MFVESPILSLNHSLRQSRGNVLEGGPVQPSPVVIDPQLLENLSVAIQKDRIRFNIGPANLRKRGKSIGRPRRSQEEEEKEAKPPGHG
jgi:hypothetical protein